MRTKKMTVREVEYVAFSFAEKTLRKHITDLKNV